MFRNDYFEGREKTPTIEVEEDKRPARSLYPDYEKDAEKAKEVREELDKIKAARPKVELKMDSFAGEPKNGDVGVDIEHRVDAFMDEIEGETLGQMLSYLSSELESSTDDRSSDDVVSRQNVDHIFEEITRVTQSTVDRYLDTILLDTLYRHAGRSAVKETERSDPDGERRCSSASGTDDAEPKPTPTRQSSGLKIRQRIKDFQRQHLLAAGEALYAVLAELKARGEVNNYSPLGANLIELFWSRFYSTLKF